MSQSKLNCFKCHATLALRHHSGQTHPVLAQLSGIVFDERAMSATLICTCGGSRVYRLSRSEGASG